MTSIFRFIFWAKSYETSVHFYRDQLECPIVMDWDRSPTERGTIFKLGSGEIEVLASTPGKETLQSQGFELASEVDDVDKFYKFVMDKNIVIRGELADKPWGHRTFSVNDPDGMKLIFFSIS